MRLSLVRLSSWAGALLLLSSCQLAVGALNRQLAQQREMKPVDPNERFERPGFSVLPPRGGKWLRGPIAPAAPGGESVLLAFVREPIPENAAPTDQHTVAVQVITRDLGAQRIGSVEQLRDLRRA